MQPHGLQPIRLPCPWDSPDKNTEVGCRFLLQGTFPTQGENPGLPHWWWILYHLRLQEKPPKLKCDPQRARGVEWEGGLGSGMGSQQFPVVQYCVIAKVKVTQSRPILCGPVDYTVHGILQARILE